MIVIDEPSIETSEKASDESDDESQKPVHTEVMDYAKMTENLFFRIYQGTIQEEALIFDQLDHNSKIDSTTGLPEMQIGEAIVNINS